MSDGSKRNLMPMVRVATAALAGTVLAVAGLGFYSPPGQPGRDAYGSPVELRGVTYLPDHTWVDGNLLQRLFARSPWPLPTEGAYRGRYPAGPPLPKPPLVLWFRAQHPSLFWSAWVDPHGCRIKTEIALETFREVRSELPVGRPLWGSPKPNPTLWAAAPAIVPRGGRAPLTFAVFEGRGGAPRGSFQVPPLPPQPDPPVWKGAAPPLSATCEDTTFTLTDFRHLTAEAAPFGRSVATFRYDGANPHCRRWRPVLIRVKDPGGNNLLTHRYRPESMSTATFNGLCVREPAWKLQVRFARPDPAGVPPDATWTWRDVPAPGRNERKFSRRSFQEGGVRFSLEEVSAYESYTHNEPGGPRGLVCLMRTALTAPEGCFLKLVRITDQNGRRVPLAWEVANDSWKVDTSYYEQHGLGEWSGHIFCREGARRLNFTFGLWRTRTVEYLVRP